MDTVHIHWTAVFLVGTAQGAFLAATLVARRGSRRKGPATLLGVLVAVFTLMIAEELVDSAGLYPRLPHLALSTFTLSMAIGPLCLLYARRITDPERRMRGADWLHFLPLVAMAVRLTPYYLLGGQEKLAALRAGFPVDLDPLVLAKAVHLIAYEILALAAVAKALPDADPTTRPHLRWYRRLLLATLPPVVYIHLLYFAPQLELLDSADSDRVGSLVLALVIYTFAFAAIRRPQFWGAGTDDRPRAAASQGAPAKYRNSPLDAATAKAHLASLHRLMESDTPYRDPELRLADVAAALDISPHALSQLLTERAGRNFYALINEYRVEDVKRRMADPAHRHRNLLALAHDAGFNSKTSFNRVFKAATGKTPSAWRRALDAGADPVAAAPGT